LSQLRISVSSYAFTFWRFYYSHGVLKCPQHFSSPRHVIAIRRNCRNEYLITDVWRRGLVLGEYVTYGC